MAQRGLKLELKGGIEWKAAEIEHHCGWKHSCYPSTPLQRLLNGQTTLIRLHCWPDQCSYIQHRCVSFTSDLSVEVEEQHDDRHVHPDSLTAPRAHASSCGKTPVRSQHAGRFKTTERLLAAVWPALPEGGRAGEENVRSSTLSGKTSCLWCSPLRSVATHENRISLSLFFSLSFSPSLSLSHTHSDG